jgi:UDP-N-acetylglucosamine 2-epimerase
MKIVTVVGARPQFIKAAPLSRALRASHHEILVHTGQHYDDAMSGVFFRELGIPRPDYNLGVGSGSHGAQTGEMLRRMEETLLTERPDRVIVFGDTNSTLAGALAAVKLQIPVAHVEAGLRSYNRAMPEEINRVVTDHLSDLLFSPTRTGVENLAREGLTQGVHLVGDVMFDALRMFLPIAQARSEAMQAFDLSPGGYALLTLHRAENVDQEERLRSLMEALGGIPMPVLFPAHPRTRARLDALGLTASLAPQIRLTEPVGYLDMLALQASARVILTDSGGVQREAFFLSVPSVILRKETEWPELVETGSSRLEGKNFSQLAPDCLLSLQPVPPGDLFGDGNAGRKIANIIQNQA